MALTDAHKTFADEVAEKMFEKAMELLVQGWTAAPVGADDVEFMERVQHTLANRVAGIDVHACASAGPEQHLGDLRWAHGQLVVDCVEPLDAGRSLFLHPEADGPPTMDEGDRVVFIVSTDSLARAIVLEIVAKGS